MRFSILLAIGTIATLDPFVAAQDFFPLRTPNAADYALVEPETSQVQTALAAGPETSTAAVQPAAFAGHGAHAVMSRNDFRIPSISESRRLASLRAEVGVFGLMRESPDGQVLAVDETFTPILDASEMQGSMQFGLRALIDVCQISQRAGGVDFQAGYFGINSLDAETTLASVEVSPVFFNSIPVTPLPTANIIYSSNIYSGEANLKFFTSGRIRPIIGLRYFKLEDYYDAFNHGVPPIIRTGGFSVTNNSLFGAQFGLEADVWETRWHRFYASGKFGVMDNDIEGAANAADALGNETTKNYAAGKFATLVDAGAGVELSVAGPLSVRIGYHALFASGLALGIDQNDSVRLLTPGETVVFNSQQWHGVNFTTLWEF